MKVGVFHPGTQHSWQTARTFKNSGKLTWYVTSVFYKKNKFPYKLVDLLPERIKLRIINQLNKRYHEDLDGDFTHEGALLEWFKTLTIRLKLKKISRILHIYSTKAFSRKVIRLLKAEPVDVIWGYDACSLEVFENSACNNLIKVLDYTTIHPREQNEILNILNSPEKLLPHTEEWIRRVERECQLADFIIVGSKYAKGTLTKHGVEEGKIHIVQYSYDDTVFDNRDSVSEINGPVKFVFVGSLKVTKGVELLLEAFKNINKEDAVLTIVGHETEEIDLSPYKSFENIEFLGGVSRSKISKILHNQDCLVLPTYFEGGGIVLYEAAASGLALIQSTNCGDGVRGQNGIVVHDQTVKEYFFAIRSVIDDREKLLGFKEVSLEISHERSFLSYQNRINDFLDTIDA